MENRKTRTKEFKELERAIATLKRVEKELDGMKPFANIFGPEMESIRRNLKRPSEAKEVEQEIEALREKVAEHKRAAVGERKEEAIAPVRPPSKPGVGVGVILESSEPKEIPYPLTGEPVDVFVSHVEEDTDIALGIALSLEELGYKTWCYQIDSLPGISYLINTTQAIERCRAFLVVISPHALSSRQITQEVVRAHESNKNFFPVLQDITHIEFQNRQPEWRAAIGSTTSIRIPPGGAAGIIARIVDGLKALDIQPSLKRDAERIAMIRRALDEL